jgi:hypothetical protein
MWVKEIRCEGVRGCGEKSNELTCCVKDRKLNE